MSKGTEMTKGIYRSIALGILALAAQPCIAADDFREAGAAERRSGSFAGAHVKVGLGGGAQTKASARLQLGFRHVYRDAQSSAPSMTRNAAVMEIGASRNFKPAVYVAGQELSATGRRLGAKGGTAPLLIAGGVVLAAVVVLAVVAASSDDEPCFFCE